MYKLLLCLKYLRTRYLAFVCIVSVMLGVATLIVVNGVMSGFSNKLKDRLHGILADVLVETERADGFDEPPQSMVGRIEASPAGKHVEAISPTVEVFALFQFHVRGKNGEVMPITKHVRLVGVDPARHARVGRFSEYLVNQKNVAGPELRPDPGSHASGWSGTGCSTGTSRSPRSGPRRNRASRGRATSSRPQIERRRHRPRSCRRRRCRRPTRRASPASIVGYSLAHYRYKDPETGENLEVELLRPGDDVFIATVGASGTEAGLRDVRRGRLLPLRDERVRQPASSTSRSTTCSGCAAWTAG